MIRIQGTIEGVAPLLFSRPFALLEGKKPGKRSDADHKEEATRRLHTDAKGAYIPMGALKGALLDGIRLAGIKDGKRSAAPLVEATIFPQHHLYLGQDTYDETLETWGRVPPRTGAAVILRYPVFRAGWTCAFTLMQALDDSTLEENVHAGLKTAGLLVGLGSWRPEYGRFQVTAWEASPAT